MVRNTAALYGAERVGTVNINPREYADLQWDMITDFLKWRREEAALAYFSGETVEEDYPASWERWLDTQQDEEWERQQDGYWDRLAASYQQEQEEMATPHTADTPASITAA
jgi:hypothetical protein